MLKTVIVLANGTQISSGTGGVAVESATIKHQVNSAALLTLGSTCAAMLDVKFKAKEGSLHLSEGEEITAYKEAADGIIHLIGRFTLQKPTRPSANSLRITAYDRVTWLDKDLSAWLAGLDGWPYSLYTLAGMVCNACGLILANSSIPNGDYQVQKFSAQGITGRKLMQWIGEAAGRFCRATPEGKIEFAWYEPSGVEITPGGDRFYYQNGLTYEDYQVAPIEKVQIKLTQDDVGVTWPNEAGEKNTYVISGNYLLTTSSTAALQPVAQTLYEQLKNVTYTPCKVQIPAGLDLQAGHTVQITDRNGKTFTSYVMTKTIAGQRETLECTGSHRRDSTAVVNSQSFEALSGKMLEIQKSVEGFSITASEVKSSAIYSTVDEFYLSISPSFLSGGAWSTERPQWTDGMYLWFRSKVTKGDGTVSYTPSENGVCITGNTGAPGAPGNDGADAIVCRIDSTTGYTFKEGETSTLTARIFVGQEEIDPNGDMEYTWYRSVDGGTYQAFARGKVITFSENSYGNYADIYFTTEGGEIAYDDITLENGVMTIRSLVNAPVQNGDVLTIA